MKKRCLKVIKLGEMSEPRRCLRSLNHSGYHTPNLKGMRFGRIKVLRFLGSPGKNRVVRWQVAINGTERPVNARSLIRGGNKGKRLHQHGFRATPEYTSVMNHYNHIFRNTQAHKYYNGMPFCDDWNPKKGGDLWHGARWIIKNLGSKPGPKWSLDVIIQAKGFVPGNLRWALKGIQMRNQRHRLLEGVSEKEFAVEAKRRGYVKTS
jgi:hypothetical protein